AATRTRTEVRAWLCHERQGWGRLLNFCANFPAAPLELQAWPRLHRAPAILAEPSTAAGSRCSAWDRAQWFCPAGDIDRGDAKRRACGPRCARPPDGKKAAAEIHERHCGAR